MELKTAMQIKLNLVSSLSNQGPVARYFVSANRWLDICTCKRIEKYMKETVSHVLNSRLSSQLLDKKKCPSLRNEVNQIYDERPSRIRMVRLQAFIKHHPAMLILHCWSNGWIEIAGPLLHSVSTTSSDFPNPFPESHEKELSRLFTRTPNLDLEAAFLSLEH